MSSEWIEVFGRVSRVVSSMSEMAEGHGIGPMPTGPILVAGFSVVSAESLTRAVCSELLGSPLIRA